MEHCPKVEIISQVEKSVFFSTEIYLQASTAEKLCSVNLRKIASGSKPPSTINPPPPKKVNQLNLTKTQLHRKKWTHKPNMRSNIQPYTNLAQIFPL